VIIILSGAAIDRNVFIFINFEAKNCVAEGKAQYDGDDDISIVGHYQHHCEDMHHAIDEDEQKVKN